MGLVMGIADRAIEELQQEERRALQQDTCRRVLLPRFITEPRCSRNRLSGR